MFMRMIQGSSLCFSNLMSRPQPQLQHSPNMVLWKTPSVPLLKVNTDGSVCGTNIAAAYCGIFRDFSACFRGCFARNLGAVSVLHAEIMATILDVELAHI
ncbi:RNA-directed DNA polymerase (Reverse transcriptase) [Trifolium medium]|uniref:RNA-directed DNA polymerase (Reverse transcriptase) n=1 Tax=Trifolium medium TaxID=97028 RepID=A0A392M8T5_9FABA|nr:RNA-directed DNA polymerase (Reverse transcriptase) [Trifolium medium]